MLTNEILDHAIAAHARWKTHLREAIDSSKSDLRPSEVRLDNLCELGKWLHALPISDRMSPEYRKLREMHADFHKQAAIILDKALQGRKAEAEEAMKSGSPFIRLSSNLILELTMMKQTNKPT